MSWWELVLMLAPGLVIGVGSLPWKHLVTPRDHELLYVLGWACFWPFGLVWVFIAALGAYRRAWWAYSDRKAAAKHLRAG